MLIAVLHRNQPDLDGLLRFLLHFRNPRGLMKWQVRARGGNGELYVEEDGETCATDGGACRFRLHERALPWTERSD